MRFPQDYCSAILSADNQGELLPPAELSQFGMTDEEKREVTKVYGVKRVRQWAEHLLNRGSDDKIALHDRVRHALAPEVAFSFDSPAQFSTYLGSDAFSAIVRAERELLWGKIEQAIPRVLCWLRNGQSRGETDALTRYLTTRRLMFYGRLESFSHLDSSASEADVRKVYEETTATHWRRLYSHLSPTVSAHLVSGAPTGVLPALPGAFAGLTPPRISPPQSAAIP
jgi:hypothetical protein